MKLDQSYFEEASFGLAIVANDFSVKYVNKNFSTILQQAEDRLLGNDIMRFMPQLKTLSLDQDHEFTSFTTRSGQTLAVDIIKNDDSYAMFCQDYTNYVQIMEQVEITNQKRIITDRMLDHLYDGCYITDGSGVTLYVNDAFLEMAALKREEVIGKSVYQLMDDKIIPTSCAAKVIETQKPSSTILNYFKGKSCLVTGAPVFIDGRLERIILTSRDLTELQALKNKLANVTSLTLTLKNQLREIEAQQKAPYTTEIRSKSMATIFDKAIKIAPLDTPLLVLGETGVGKDFLVQFIHSIYKESSEQHLIKLNCGAIPNHLLESELFGYAPGAFTDASKHGKVGLFELARNGTLFLDEIGDMPLPLQAKILNVLQDKVFYRVGGTHLIETNARIIAATNKNLEALITQKKFREDLYYRLNVINVVIPPLRKRKDDIIPLAMFFLEQYNSKYQKSRYYSTRMLEIFLSYSWPGNIREMKNMIERLVVMSSRDCIEIESIEEHIVSSFDYVSTQDLQLMKHTKDHNLTSEDASSPELLELSGTLKGMMNSHECRIIQSVLDQSSSLKDAAQQLGVDISTLVRKKQKYKI